MAEHTPHQKRIVQGYYDNRSSILLTRLGEIVSDLYLAETDAQRNRLWKRAEQAMAGLEVPPKLLQRILGRKDVEVLARNLTGWLEDAGKDRKGGRKRR